MIEEKNETPDFGDIGSFDTTEVPPAAPDGEWEGRVTAKVRAANGTNFPQLVLTWTLETAKTEGNEPYEGTELTHFITLYPKTHKNHRRSVQACKELSEGLEVQAVPTSRFKGDYAALIEELEGRQGTLWTKTSGQFTNINYVRPRSYMAAEAE